jgi:DNA-binding PadR family transcriptional regulator
MGRRKVSDAIFSDSEDARYQILKSLVTRTDQFWYEIRDCLPFTTYRLKIIAATNLEYIKRLIDNMLKYGLIQRRTHKGKIIYDITPKGEEALEIYKRQRELLDR